MIQIVIMSLRNEPQYFLVRNTLQEGFDNQIDSRIAVSCYNDQKWIVVNVSIAETLPDLQDCLADGSSFTRSRRSKN